MERLLSKGQVIEMVGLSYPTIWQRMRTGRFPRSVAINGVGTRVNVRWRESEVLQWIDDLPRQELKVLSTSEKRKLRVRPRLETQDA